MGEKLTYSKNIKYWIIPISVVSVLWFLAGIAWFYHEKNHDSELRIETEVTGEQIKLRLESWVNHRIEIVENMANHWGSKGKIDNDIFTQKADELLSWIPGLQALNWIDKNWTIQVVVPLEGNEPALGKNLRYHPFVSVQEALKKAQETRQISRTTVIKLLQGGDGFVTYWPVVSKDGEIFGYINGVFKINQLIENCFSEPMLTERFSIMFYEEDKTVYAKDMNFSANQLKLMKEIAVEFVDKNLQMKIMPTTQYIESLQDYISYWIFGFTFFLSLWLGFMFRVSMLHNQIIRKSEERLRTVIENAGDAFYLISKDGKIVDVNQQACTELQYTKEELTSMVVEDIDIDYVKGDMKVENGITVTFEANHKKKDGTTMPVEIRSGLIDINKKEYILFLSRDISETKKLQELENRAQRLETAGQVAGQVAHDFNNLLAPLIAYPDFIKGMLSDNHPAFELLTKIEKSANQIAEINQQLLTLGRRGHYTQKIINLNDLIHEVVEEVGIHSQSCNIKIDFDHHLLPIKGGYSQLVRIVTNLLHNAYDAIQADGVISVKTENYYLDESTSDYFCVPKGEYVKLTIADSGCGIPENILPTIFDPFVSTKKTNKKRGSGLGLSIVESVINDHNGHVDVKSIVGEGTQFYLYFPISRDKIKEEIVVEVVRGNEKILIVDDDITIIEVTQKILEMLGYYVKTSETGEAALDMMEKESFDLLILDMIIPNSIDGTEIFKRALQINPQQKAIIVSGYAETERVNEAMRLGVYSFTKKPFTKEIISNEIRNALQKETSASI